MKKLTAIELGKRKGVGPKIAALTAYDATMARLLDAGGADILLVGDSLGMVVQGLSNTLQVTVDDICYHARAVARGAERAHVVGDLPFMSYQESPEQAVRNAGRLVKEGACEAVKLEGGQVVAEHVRRIVACGIPVMGHIGLTPQSIHAMGGFRVQGKSASEAERLLQDAQALEQAGAYSLVLEGVPAELAERITQRVRIPTIGIGAGPACDGQVLVCYDFLGMYRGLQPKFVKRFAELGALIVQATQSYVNEVAAGKFPADEHTFKAPAGLLGELSGTVPVVGQAKPPEGYGPNTDENS
ncbi:MAG: 3-methyl-2-oxobutanoate hydroxymethyltransferase [Polyangiaceae bacterium]|nr:3-methyl-2-oxobutanoate hydroxymethyltransferase [Polyangiaceae bacterium]